MKKDTSKKYAPRAVVMKLAAERLGVTRGHLYATLGGYGGRKSESLKKRFNELILSETAAALN